MQTYIAFLRGINVSGHKKIPMAELRELLSKSDFENVETYIQSGNIIFKSSEVNTQKLELEMHNTIKKHFGFEVPILITTPDELRTVFDDCPFPEEKKVKSYFTLLYDSPDKNLIAEVSKIKYPNEEFIITNNCIYFYCSTGYGKAKYSNNFFEKKFKTRATARNYKTMVKLIAMSTVK